MSAALKYLIDDETGEEVLAHGVRFDKKTGYLIALPADTASDEKFARAFCGMREEDHPKGMRPEDYPVYGADAHIQHWRDVPMIPLVSPRRSPFHLKVA